MTALLVVLLALALPAQAWGPKGHAAVGILALEHTDAKARAELEAILGSLDAERLDAACNWPDHIRDDPAWDWAAPQHYVNLPRAADDYDAERDCPDGVCVTEGIKKYADKLMDKRLLQQRREEAFAWLCHLVADLHQPLHAGFADDRRGNAIQIVFDGEEGNLHWFWDSLLVPDRIETLEALVGAIPQRECDTVPDHWSPAEVDAWTEESHRLAGTVAYPPSNDIDARFAEKAWNIARRRLGLAAQRLAQILNATVGDGEVVIERKREPRQ